MEEIIEEKTRKIEREENEYFAVDWWGRKIYKGFGGVYYVLEGSNLEIRSFRSNAAAKAIFFHCWNQRFSWGNVQYPKGIIRHLYKWKIIRPNSKQIHSIL
jgi:hypothetical protein